MKKTLLPGGMAVTVSRDYGETAEEKSNELIESYLPGAFGPATASQRPRPKVAVGRWQKDQQFLVPAISPFVPLSSP